MTFRGDFGVVRRRELRTRRVLKIEKEPHSQRARLGNVRVSDRARPEDRTGPRSVGAPRPTSKGSGGALPLLFFSPPSSMSREDPREGLQKFNRK